MALIKRNELDSLLSSQSLTSKQVFLFFGERFLCRESGDKLQKQLLKNQAGTVQNIDGDQEDQSKTLNQLMNFSLLPGRQIFRVTDTRLFSSKAEAKQLWEKARKANSSGNSKGAARQLQRFADLGGIKREKGETLSSLTASQWEECFGFQKPSESLAWADKLLEDCRSHTGSPPRESIRDLYIESIKNGFPQTNHLILTVDTVDRRQKLFTAVKKHGIVIDCSVDTGTSKMAQQAQKDVLFKLADDKLKEFGKTIEPAARDLFFSRIGFYPVAVVMEMEKLVLYTGDRKKISRQDVEETVARNKEDALFEYTDAIGNGQPAQAEILLSRLLENGIHPLAIIASLRNYIKKLLVFRSLQHLRTPLWIKGMSANQFQNSYLPELKQNEETREYLKGHPYGLYMSFNRASTFSCTILKKWLEMVLEAEFRLKGSPIDNNLILQELTLALFIEKKKQ